VPQAGVLLWGLWLFHPQLGLDISFCDTFINSLLIMGCLTTTIVKACAATTILDLMFVLRSLSGFISRLVWVTHKIFLSFRKIASAKPDQVTEVKPSLSYQPLLLSVPQPLGWLLIGLPTCLLLLVSYQIKVEFGPLCLQIQMLHLPCRVEAISLQRPLEVHSLFCVQEGCRATGEGGEDSQRIRK
jgi:hypothetical protein